ncbi:MAG: sugar transferase [Tissierellia bacterium]|nr:sugar transferase [Tissierellia bacterium]
MEKLQIEEQEIIELRKSQSSIYEITKRIMDILLSLIAIIILSPLFLIISILIRLDSKGKVIFGHERIGKDMRKIKVYKFRTMYENAAEIFEKFSEEQKREYYINFKLDNDPRITKIGSFLRRTSLDELPQLINIIKGDMSIVGPRPIVEKEIEKYGVYAKSVFSTMPGLTGYWQANGRSDTTYDERVQMDMYYIKNKSITMDFKIILKTITAVAKEEGAI